MKKSEQSVIHQNLPYRFLRGQPLKALDKFRATLEIRVLPLSSFKIMERKLYLLHNILIFCDIPG